MKKKTAQADRSSSTETRAKTRHTKKKSATGTKTSRVDSPANPGEGFNESEEIWFQEAPYSEQAKDALPRATPPLERNESGSEPEFFQGKPVNHSRDPVEMDLEIRNLISDLVMVLLETQDFVRLGQILEEYTDFIGDMKLLLKSRSS